MDPPLRLQVLAQMHAHHPVGEPNVTVGPAVRLSFTSCGGPDAPLYPGDPLQGMSQVGIDPFRAWIDPLWQWNVPFGPQSTLSDRRIAIGTNRKTMH